MRLEYGLGAQRLLPYCCQEWSEAHRRNSKLYWLGHSCSEPYSLSLAMGLTTLAFVHRNSPKSKILISKKIGGLRTFVATLPMSGGQGVAVPRSIDFGSLKIGSDPRFRNGADSHEAAAKESTYA